MASLRIMLIQLLIIQPVLTEQSVPTEPTFTMRPSTESTSTSDSSNLGILVASSINVSNSDIASEMSPNPVSTEAAIIPTKPLLGDTDGHNDTPDAPVPLPTKPDSPDPPHSTTELLIPTKPTTTPSSSTSPSRSSSFNTTTIPSPTTSLPSTTIPIVTTTTSQASSSPPERCEEEWKFHLESCYFFSRNRLSWVDAMGECRAKDSHLVIVETYKEKQYIQRQILHHDEHGVWVSATDSNTGDWQWYNSDTGIFTDINASFINIHNRKKRNAHNAHEVAHCLYTKLNEEDEIVWYGKECSSHKQYICERPAL